MRHHHDYIFDRQLGAICQTLNQFSIHHLVFENMMFDIKLTDPIYIKIIIIIYKMNEILEKSFKGGLSGAAAMGVQVTSLMWLRTTMNYQYRHGTGLQETFHKLYKEGGVRRFYRGYSVAIVQGPLARFGDTGTNTVVMKLLEDVQLPTPVKTVAASASAASFRIIITPIDTIKTTLQVEGKHALKLLRNRGVLSLWNGALGSASATFVGHYPWFMTYNTLQANIPLYDTRMKSLLRNAGIGFSASVISDILSNGIRVLKTTKQTHEKQITYVQAAKEVMAKDGKGVIGLLTRGLHTRILTNGISGDRKSVV